MSVQAGMFKAAGATQKLSGLVSRPKLTSFYPGQKYKLPDVS